MKKNGIASLENFGLLLRLPIFPPTTIATPSRSASLIEIGGQTVKQFPQYMHLSKLMEMLFFAGFGLIADVGHEATTVGISHIFPTVSSFTTGIFVCRATMAISEQCTAPHMFTQQATASRTLFGSSFVVK